jgi:hypothetical protein
MVARVGVVVKLGSAPHWLVALTLTAADRNQATGALVPRDDLCRMLSCAAASEYGVLSRAHLMPALCVLLACENQALSAASQWASISTGSTTPAAGSSASPRPRWTSI